MSAAAVSPAAVISPAVGVRPDASSGNFHMATVMFLRTRQLRDGARPRVDGRGHRNTHIAQAEVMARLISWDREDA